MRYSFLFLCFVTELLALALIVETSAHAAASSVREKFTEPSRGITFDLPGRGWKASAGFGDEIASIKGPNRARIDISWRQKTKPLQGSDEMAQAVMDEYPGARLKSVEQLDLGRQRAVIARFEGKEGLSGALIALSVDDGTVRIACTDDARAFVGTFLSCRALADSVSFEEPSSDPSAFANAVKSVKARAEFAWLDGQAGCAGIADEPRRMARVAGNAGEGLSAHELTGLSEAIEQNAEIRDENNPGLTMFLKARALARMGRVESARSILARLAQEKDGMFAALDLARISLEEGNMGDARRIISRIDSNRYNGASDSHMLAALRIWLARLEGDTATARGIFESMGR